MSYNKIIRQNASRLVKKNLLSCIIIMFILMLCVISSSLLDGVMYFTLSDTVLYLLLRLIILNCFSLFLLSPLILGIGRWFWRLTFDVKDNPAEIFHFFSDKKNYKKAFVLSAAKYLPSFIQMLISEFAPQSEKLAEKLFGKNLFVSSAVNSIFIVLSFAVTILMIWLTTKLFLSGFLLYNDENLSAADAIKLSFKISKGNFTKIIGFFLGFIGWMLLSVFIIPLVYTYPLMLTAQALFARSMIIRYNYDLKMKGNVSYAG